MLLLAKAPFTFGVFLKYDVVLTYYDNIMNILPLAKRKRERYTTENAKGSDITHLCSSSCFCIVVALCIT